jgi:hypothetical protein
MKKIYILSLVLWFVGVFAPILSITFNVSSEMIQCYAWAIPASVGAALSYSLFKKL